MASSAKYVAVYDISDDKERDRVAKALEGYGIRVQFSVFECRLTSVQRKQLLGRIDSLEIESGFLYLYRVSGRAPRYVAGVPPEEPFGDDKYAWVI